MEGVVDKQAIDELIGRLDSIMASTPLPVGVAIRPNESFALGTSALRRPSAAK